MKVYLAAPYSWKLTAIKAAFILEDAGFKVTSRWLEEKSAANSVMSEFDNAWLQGTAEIDIEDIDAADVLILFTLDPEKDKPLPRGGRHFEAGYAYGKGKHVIIVGPRENVFYYLPTVRWFDSFLEAKKYLVDLREEQESGYRPSVHLRSVSEKSQPVQSEFAVPAQCQSDAGSNV